MKSCLKIGDTEIMVKKEEEKSTLELLVDNCRKSPFPSDKGICLFYKIYGKDRIKCEYAFLNGKEYYCTKFILKEDW